MNATNTPELRIMHGWLVEYVGEHTCGAGDEYGHEPTCGYEPLMKVEELAERLDELEQLRGRLGDMTKAYDLEVAAHGKTSRAYDRLYDLFVDSNGYEPTEDELGGAS